VLSKSIIKYGLMYFIVQICSLQMCEKLSDHGS